jgi:hypothetical protein
MHLPKFTSVPVDAHLVFDWMKGSQRKKYFVNGKSSPLGLEQAGAAGMLPEALVAMADHFTPIRRPRNGPPVLGTASSSACDFVCRE